MGGGLPGRQGGSHLTDAASSQEGATLLHFASRWGLLEMVGSLLSAGQDKDSKTKVRDSEEPWGCRVVVLFFCRQGGFTGY